MNWKRLKKGDSPPDGFVMSVNYKGECMGGYIKWSVPDGYFNCVDIDACLYNIVAYSTKAEIMDDFNNSPTCAEIIKEYKHLDLMMTIFK